MPVPPVPFLASQALDEFGAPSLRLVSELAGQGGGPGVPFLLSAFAGRSAGGGTPPPPPPLGATATPDSIFSAGLGQTGASRACTANPFGGTGAYSYAWSVLSGAGGSVANAGAQTATLSISGVAPNEDRTVVFRLAVSDGPSTVVVDVPFTHSHTTLQ